MPNSDEVNSVNKAVGILKLFREQSELGITEIAYLMDMAKGSVYRFVNTLKKLGLLEQNPETEKYRPAVGLLELSSLYVSHLDWQAVARPFMELLSEKTHEDIFLGVLDKTNVVYVDKIEGKQGLRMVSQIGLQRPAYCTGTGKALLATLSKPQLLEIFKGQELSRYTERTITSFSQLLEELALIQKKGFAFDDEEYETGVIGIGAPLRGMRGEVLGSISVSGPKIRINAEKVDEIAALVIEVCKEISRRLGWQETQNYNF
jgi:IclR family KDG regulon transcriptional repressor